MIKEFRLKAKASLDDVDDPLFIKLSMTKELAERIQFLVQQVFSLDVLTIGEWCYEPAWYEVAYDEDGEPHAGQSVRVQCETLNVQREYIVFSCYRKHSFVEYYSEKIQLEDFLPFFGLEVPGKQSEVRDEENHNFSGLQ
jgi:hypothetical protein